MTASGTVRAFVMVLAVFAFGATAAEGQSNGESIPDVTPVRIAAAPDGGDSRMVLLAGLAVPGLGHLYSGRPLMGAAVFGMATVSIIAGAVSTRTRIWCTAPVVTGSCPSGFEHARAVEHHRAGTAVAGAVLITAAGAVHAYLTARKPSSTPVNSESASSTGSTRFGPHAIAWDGRSFTISLARFAF